MSSPSLLPFLFLAAILHPTAALPGDHLAVSDFVSEELPFVQDWSITYGVPGLADKAAAAAAAGNVVLSREGAGGVVDGLKGSDTGNYKWYVTPFPHCIIVTLWPGTLRLRSPSLTLTQRPPTMALYRRVTLFVNSKPLTFLST
jgi:hypothetical protein